MSIEPGHAMRWVRRLVYLTVVILVVVAIREFQFVRVQPGDDSTPQISPGTLLFCRPVREDGEVIEGALYLAGYPTEDGVTLRMVRAVGVPKETVERTEKEVRVGGRRLSLPPYAAAEWPAEIPAGECLLLTDNPNASHPDSRMLGPVPVQMLYYRVLSPLSF